MKLEKMLGIIITNKEQLQEIARNVVISLAIEDEYTLLDLSEEAQKAIPLPKSDDYIRSSDEINMQLVVLVRGYDFELNEFADGFIAVARKKLRKFVPSLTKWLSSKTDSVQVFDYLLQARQLNDYFRRFSYTSDGDVAEVTICPNEKNRLHTLIVPKDGLRIHFSDGSFFAVTNSADVTESIERSRALGVNVDYSSGIKGDYIWH
jgi:hypothetical protein